MTLCPLFHPIQVGLQVSQQIYGGVRYKHLTTSVFSGMATIAFSKAVSFTKPVPVKYKILLILQCIYHWMHSNYNFFFLSSASVIIFFAICHELTPYLYSNAPKSFFNNTSFYKILAFATEKHLLLKNTQTLQIYIINLQTYP